MAISFALLAADAHSLSFNFPNVDNLTLQDDAFVFSSKVIQLTHNQQDDNLTRSVGRVSYDKPVRLWDAKTGRLTNFFTHFAFVMKALNPHGDEISFFITPFDFEIPVNSSGRSVLPRDGDSNDFEGDRAGVSRICLGPFLKPEVMGHNVPLDYLITDLPHALFRKGFTDAQNWNVEGCTPLPVY